VVVPADPARAVSLAEVVQFCKDAKLATQKIPEQLELVGELPRNASGKVLKYQLRERYAGSR
jgi:acyl-CoA synthetase (AMP-forming)/AMP-acid ligase II